MTIYSGILSVSPLSHFILGSEYLALEATNDLQNIENGTIVTYIGEEWITKRLADLNDPEALWIGWGTKDRIQTWIEHAVTIDVDPVAKTFTRVPWRGAGPVPPLGSFIDEGFLPGQTITFSGFDSVGNNASKLISSVTNTTITVTTDFGLVEELGSGHQKAVTFISKRNLAIFDEIDERDQCVLEYTEGEGDEAFYKVIGTLIASGPRSILEIGIFDAPEAGNLLVHSVFYDLPYTLEDGDSTMFTVALNPE